MSKMSEAFFFRNSLKSRKRRVFYQLSDFLVLLSEAFLHSLHEMQKAQPQIWSQNFIILFFFAKIKLKKLFYLLDFVDLKLVELEIEY